MCLLTNFLLAMGSQPSWSKNPRQHRSNFVAILLSGYGPAVWFRGSHCLLGAVRVGISQLVTEKDQSRIRTVG